LHSHAHEGAPGFEAGASAVSPLEHFLASRIGTGPENRTRRIRLVRAVSSPDEPVPCVSERRCFGPLARNRTWETCVSDRHGQLAPERRCQGESSRYGDQDSNLNFTASKAGVLTVGPSPHRCVLVRGSGFAPESHGFRGRCPAVGPSPRSCRSHRRELHPLRPAYHAGIPLPGSRRHTHARQWNWRESHPLPAACKAAARTSRSVPFVNWWKLEGVAPSSGCLQGNGPHLVVSPVTLPAGP
jgi:hypothetical protein